MALSSAESLVLLVESPDAVSVSYGSPTQTTTGVLDREQAEADGERSGFVFVGPAFILTIATGALTSLTQDSSITVDSTSYKIRDIGFDGTDGFRRLQLVAASP